MFAILLNNRHTVQATPQCILKLRQVYPQLRDNYRRIADYLLANPARIFSSRVRDVSRAVGCDDSQIVRFCHKIGYDGFVSLRASIAAELMPLTASEASPASADSFEQIKQQFLAHNITAMRDTLGVLRKQDLALTVRKLVKAKRIFLFGTGASGIVVLDAQMKLMRMGYHVICHQDPDVVRMLLGLASAGDVLVAVSFSGENRSTCDLAAQARERKMFVAAVTNFPNSALSRLADVSLLTASDEKQFRIGATTSRIAQCLVVDFLIMNLAMNNAERIAESVLRTTDLVGVSKGRQERASRISEGNGQR